MPSHSSTSGVVSPASPLKHDSESVSRLQQSILLTILYADLFEYPLTEDELYRRLIDCSAPRDHFQQALASLTGESLTASKDFVTWRGREHLVERRRFREELSTKGWQAARQYAGWLRWVPFMRMVAVSGSLALDNATPEGDVDLFCITDSHRLWLTRLCLVPLSKCTRAFNRIFPWYLCPNYLLTREALEVEERNLFTAYEAVQAVPLWGDDTYTQFLEANEWIEGYLPHSSPIGKKDPRKEAKKPWFTRGIEWLLDGTAGDLLDRWIYRSFAAFYRRRAQQRGWQWSRLKKAYRRERYTVPEGGYIQVVRRYFFKRARERMGGHVSEHRLHRLFPEGDTAYQEHCYDWEELFQDEYGVTP